MKRIALIAAALSMILNSTAYAKIELDGPLSPPSGSGFALPENPTELLDKAVNSLPQTKEELDAVGSKIKDSFSTETGQKVRAVVKDIGKAFVWATELMVRWIKILLEKL